jgi:hypothetical protein
VDLKLIHQAAFANPRLARDHAAAGECGAKDGLDGRLKLEELLAAPDH